VAEQFSHYNPYNYCFNNPMLFIDPNGMAPKWNGQYGSESAYLDDETGKEVSWDDVQKAYGIGTHFKFTSVLITQPFNPKLPTYGSDYSYAQQVNGRWTAVRFLKNGTATSTITNVYFDSFGRIHYK
jgi:hypothetical protein